MDFKEKFDECDARFEAIFNLTSAASKIINSDLKILKVNEALTDLLGYSRDEIVGTEIMEYACDEDKPHWQALQKAMWEDGKPDFKLDACLGKKDGSLAWVHVTTVRFEDDGVAYAYTVLDDFTDWKSLQESEQRLSMALKYSKMAVFELNLADRSMSRYDGFDQVLGLTDSDENWSQERLIQHLLPEDQDMLRKALTDIEPGQSFDFQGRVKTPDGVIKWLNFQGRAEKVNGNQARLLGTMYDITRDKLIERQKDDFISIASHELKTPLTALKGSLQVLDRSKQTFEPKLAALVDQAGKSMMKVNSLVDDLLNASRLGEDQLHLRRTRFNISKAIDECCLHVTAGGVYNIIVEGQKDIEVDADSERIQRVIVNFVNNAVKYAPKSKDIKIQIAKEGTHVKISVTDEGPGIAKDKLSYLFDRHYRTDTGGGQYSGLGLGLYISSEIIKRHGGQIGVESELEKGSTFWFTLPLS